MKSPGQIAYENYFGKHPIHKWEQITDNRKEEWEKTANAVLENQWRSVLEKERKQFEDALRKNDPNIDDSEFQKLSPNLQNMYFILSVQRKWEGWQMAKGIKLQ